MDGRGTGRDLPTDTPRPVFRLSHFASRNSPQSGLAHGNWSRVLPHDVLFGAKYRPWGFIRLETNVQRTRHDPHSGLRKDFRWLSHRRVAKVFAVAEPPRFRNLTEPYLQDTTYVPTVLPPVGAKDSRIRKIV